MTDGLSPDVHIFTTPIWLTNPKQGIKHAGRALAQHKYWVAIVLKQLFTWACGKALRNLYKTPTGWKELGHERHTITLTVSDPGEGRIHELPFCTHHPLPKIQLQKLLQKYSDKCMNDGVAEDFWLKKLTKEFHIVQCMRRSLDFFQHFFQLVQFFLFGSFQPFLSVLIQVVLWFLSNFALQRQTITVWNLTRHEDSTLWQLRGLHLVSLLCLVILLFVCMFLQDLQHHVVICVFTWCLMSPLHVSGWVSKHVTDTSV